jgi:hypothetical protein
MSAPIDLQLRDYTEFFEAQMRVIDLDEIMERRLGTESVRPIGGLAHSADLRQSRRWPVALAAAAAVFVLVGGARFLFQVSEPAAPVADTVVPTTFTESTPTTVAEQELTNLPGCDAASIWTRVCDVAAGFDRAVMWSVTAGGPGVVAVGGEGFYYYSREDIDPFGNSGEHADAVVWTSPDRTSWSRVSHDESVFGGDGVQQMFSVTVGGPGLVAVGFDGTLDNEQGNAAVWTSPDGFAWSRVPHDEAVFGGAGEQRMLSVTGGGPGLVAVGYDWPNDADLVDAAVWTSPDGFTWSRVPHDEAVFGGASEQKMLSVTVGGPGLVAVGSDGHPDDVEDGQLDTFAADAAVWTSPDGFTWSRVAHDEAVFGGNGEQRMLSVTGGGPGLVAVGSVTVEPGWFSDNHDAAVWTSPDGITWSRVPHDKAVFAVSYCYQSCDGSRWADGNEVMMSVTSRGQGLVAVGTSGWDQAGWNAAVWTSPDGITWTPVLGNEGAFLGDGYDRMFSVTVAGSGLVAVGREAAGDHLVAAVWHD